jgi:hypothetical protein
MNDETEAGRQTRHRRIALGLRLGRFARYYLLVIGLLGLLSAAIHVALGRGPAFYLSTVIFLAIAGGLWRFHDSARVVAIAVCAIFIADSLVALGLGLGVIQGSPIIQWAPLGKEYESASPVTVILMTLGFVVVFGIPLGVLLHPAARHTFQAKTRLRQMRLQPSKWD